MPSWDLSKDIDLLMKFWRIRLENGYEFPKDFNQFHIQCRKSALLHRMLEGKEPLPVPPPKSHSYPWYELIEEGIGYPLEVWRPKSWDACFTPYPSIVIDQSPWKLIEELGEDEWIVTYPYGDSDSQKFADGKWHVRCVGSRFPQMTNSDSLNKLWEIKKIEEPST
jgi:hypothetical protein